MTDNESGLCEVAFNEGLSIQCPNERLKAERNRYRTALLEVYAFAESKCRNAESVGSYQACLDIRGILLSHGIDSVDL